jgi:CheY-like chemotaxis protein
MGRPTLAHDVFCAVEEHPVDEPLRTLIVDDATDCLRVTARLLTMLGCQVADCNDPHGCLAKAKHFRPELVLLDLAMPQMDGFTLARALKDLEIPPYFLAALTGHGDPEIRKRCEEEGFDYFLLKPTPVSEIEAVIQRAREQRARV